VTLAALANIASLSVDFVTGFLTVEPVGAQPLAIRGPVGGDFGAVSSAKFNVRASRAEIVVAGATVTIDIGDATSPVPDRVVYLDQNHWVGFARWRAQSPHRNPSFDPFFALLAEATRNGDAVVPLSAAHLTETSRRGGSSRVDLASSMLVLSRGWQLRDASALRRAELRGFFGGSPLVRGDVIGLEPYIALDGIKRPKPLVGFSPELDDLILRLSWATAQAAILVDKDPQPAGTDIAQRWAESFAALAQHIRGNSRAKAHLRPLTRTRFITDLGNDLPAAAAEAGLTPEDFGTWMNDEAERSIAGAPGLARIRELFHLRLASADEKWEANDLYDVTYLSYAAAYCDLVVGEKKTINHLRRIRPQVPAGAVLHHRPDEALPDLKALLS